MLEKAMNFINGGKPIARIYKVDSAGVDTDYSKKYELKAPEGVETFTLKRGFGKAAVSVPGGTIHFKEESQKTVDTKDSDFVSVNYGFVPDEKKLFSLSQRSQPDTFKIFTEGKHAFDDGQNLFDSIVGDGMFLAENKPLFILTADQKPQVRNLREGQQSIYGQNRDAMSQALKPVSSSEPAVIDLNAEGNDSQKKAA
jgi:hypothetical protein